MIGKTSSKQLSLPEFGVPFACQLDPENRWVKWAALIPWDELEEIYYQRLDPSQGRPANSGRMMIGAVIIKHKKSISDVETVAEITESPYLQFFCGLPEFSTRQPFAPSLLVEVRKRMGSEIYEQFHQAIINKVEEVVGRGRNRKVTQKPKTPDGGGDEADVKPELSAKAEPSEKTEPLVKDTDKNQMTEPKSADKTKEDKKQEESKQKEPANQGKLLVDATVAEQMIRYPTDLSLLNEGREILEGIIDNLFKHSQLKKKPRTYRRKARKEYLGMAKQRRPKKGKLRAAIRKQLQYVRRNIAYVEKLLESIPEDQPFPWTRRQQRHFWIIQHLYTQQRQMWREKTKRCDDRIVSIHQPHVRPIKRGKQRKPVEFGAKLSVSMDRHGLAHVDHLGWDAFNEGGDLIEQVETYKKRYGHYPEVVLADPLYGTRANRKFLKEKGIRFAGKPLGRPKKQTYKSRDEQKAEAKRRREEYRQRIPIEGKFGQGKNGYGLAKIRARRQDTSESWIHAIFLVMNLAVLFREVFLHLFPGLFLLLDRAIASQMVNIGLCAGIKTGKSVRLRRYAPQPSGARLAF